MTHRQVAANWDALPFEISRFLGDDLPREVDLFHFRDQREHQPDVGGGTRSKQCPHLGPQDFGLVETDPDGSPAQERICFGGGTERRGELVAAQIVAPDHDGVSGKAFADPLEELDETVILDATYLRRDARQRVYDRCESSGLPCRAVGA